MTSKEKMEYFKGLLKEKAVISNGKGFIWNVSPILDLKKGKIPSVWTNVLITADEQIDIIKKLESNKFITFSVNDRNKFLIVINNEDDDEEIKLKDGILCLNKNTGLVKLNNVQNIFNPTSEEFRIIYSLFKNKDNRAIYKQLLGDRYSKTNIRQLGFKIRNIKKFLGILPAKKSKNKDIFENIKGYGYKLIK